MSFWPTLDHWSVQIPLDTPHVRMPGAGADRGGRAVADAGRRAAGPSGSRSSTWIGRAAATPTSPRSPSADGELDCRGFWDKGKTDKDAQWTSNADKAPTVRAYVDAVGANFGRVRIIKLEPQDRETAIRSLHRDDNNRFNPDDEGWVVRSWVELTDNPDSYMLLMDSGPDGLPDPSTEIRVRLRKGARFVVDTQRLWHVVVHNGTAPRYALITSFESGPALEGWIDSQLPAKV